MSATIIAACASASAIPATRTWCCTGAARLRARRARPWDGWLPKALGALADESALLAEGTGKADER
jgi:hypothetical protein